MLISVSIDRGGTFCDVHAACTGRAPLTFKLLSVDPANYPDAPTEGIRRVLEHYGGSAIPKGTPLSLESIESIRMGTTVATNALLERKGANVALITTKGFRDVLEIGTQTRPNIFDLSAKKLEQLYSQVVEVDERVTLAGYTEGKVAGQQGALSTVGVSGEVVDILTPLDEDKVRVQLGELYSAGVRTVAICLLHAYTFPEHEAKVAALARELGFATSVSHELQPMISVVSRASSTVADAYLLPVLSTYLTLFAAGFAGGVAAFGNKLLFMQLNGGLARWDKFSGLRALLLGPAGGVVGYASTCLDPTRATIGFDMGGTLTDVSRVHGAPEHIMESVISQVRLQTPQLDISTVAAGGGSMLFFRNGMFVVGPESALAHPGPACYRKGGPLTVTDANLLLGRLVPEEFPKIFGPNEDLPLDVEVVKTKFAELAREISTEVGKTHTPEEVASGFIKVAIETMCRPIRTLTEAKGHATSDHTLALFGGAGGQCAVSVARNLGIDKVVIHRYLSLLSAYGMALADVVVEKQAPTSVVFQAGVLDAKVEQLRTQCLAEVQLQGLVGAVTTEVLLHMRYAGSDTHLTLAYGDAAASEFVAKHRAEFGFSLARDVVVDDVRVRCIVETTKTEEVEWWKEYTAEGPSVTSATSAPAFFDSTGWVSSPIHKLAALPQGAVVEGPAIILDDTQTIVVEPASTAHILSHHVVLDVAKEQVVTADEISPITLSIFGHRFMLVAEQMGRTLQKTLVSTNIKERLDFSCAVFDNDGNLVANAPHVPIHLGAMLYAVREQARRWAGNINEGDVFVLNHPVAGGSHLPDITVVTPVVRDGVVRFWTASRGHHADVGGIAAGSMPPHSKSIHEEGAAIVSFKLCVGGEFDEAGITELLMAPAKFPGCLGTRGLEDNLSDLRAQVSANRRGVSLLEGLVDTWGYAVVDRYMKGIIDAAAVSVRNLLRTVRAAKGPRLSAEDRLDDGTLIALDITIAEDGTAVFDFSRSGAQLHGNLNAPKAVVCSAVLYVLRCLVAIDIPLNHGCLVPVEVRTAPNSVLEPGPDCATVGGNVETSQRVVDTVLKAFGSAADSQGTCNNFTFGSAGDAESSSFGYYETICGGSGAGPGWHGQLAVQCHTTNTKITDAEVFEKRYPVVLREFGIRRGSGGRGRWSGGDGVVRDVEFTVGLEVNILSERRAGAPHGMGGGADGLRGENYWVKRDGTRLSLGGKNSVRVAPGDRVVVMTPGGGGWGSGEAEAAEASDPPAFAYTGSLGMRSEMETTN